MPLVVVFYCLNENNEGCETKKDERKNQIINMPYINTAYRTTQYNLYILQKYVKSIQLRNCDEQLLKKNRKQGEVSNNWCARQHFQKYLKILHML